MQAISFNFCTDINYQLISIMTMITLQVIITNIFIIWHNNTKHKPRRLNHNLNVALEIQAKSAATVLLETKFQKGRNERTYHLELDVIGYLLVHLAGLTLMGGHNLFIIQLHDGQGHNLLLQGSHLLLLLGFLLLQELQVEKLCSCKF